MFELFICCTVFVTITGNFADSPMISDQLTVRPRGRDSGLAHSSWASTPAFFSFLFTERLGLFDLIKIQYTGWNIRSIVPFRLNFHLAFAGCMLSLEDFTTPFDIPASRTLQYASLQGQLAGLAALAMSKPWLAFEMLI